MSSDKCFKTKVMLPEGTYLIGDPCFAFAQDVHDNNLWDKWLSKVKGHILDGSVDGMRIVSSGTCYGDGEYSDQDGFLYYVDTGNIGAVNIDYIPKLYPAYKNLSHNLIAKNTQMRLVTFRQPFDISYYKGIIFIGHIVIHTMEDDDEY